MSSQKASVLYSAKEVTEIILTNIVKMLIARKIVEVKDKKKTTDTLKKQIKDELFFELKYKKTKIGIRIIKYKVTSLPKVNRLLDFLEDDSYTHKLIIIENCHKFVKI